MNELNFSFNFDLSSFSTEGQIFDTRYIKPKKRVMKPHFIKYDNAVKLAHEIKIEKDERYFVRVSGNFILGDLIEAFVVENNYHVKRMTIETLSLSQDNIDSFHNLLKGNYVDDLLIVISDYFYSHERGDLIPYMYKQLDIENKFQLAVCSTHCKIALFETYCGKFFVIHGSANLRSSANIEQIVFEESEELYNFNQEIADNITVEYLTINKKRLSKTALWQQVQKDSQK